MRIRGDFVPGRTVHLRHNRQVENVTIFDGWVAGEPRAEELLIYQLIERTKGSFVSSKVLDLNRRNRLEVLNCRSFIPRPRGPPVTDDRQTS